MLRPAPSSETKRSRLHVLACTACCIAAVTLAAATGAAQSTAAVAGDVHDGQGKPLAGISVSIVTAAGVAGTVTTDGAGKFAFATGPAKPYTVRAENPQTKAHADLAVNAAESRPLHLVLVPAAGASMEFTDAPGFTIAGVTDWTAVGGHGSDATLRTSEDLARETVDLRAPSGSGATRPASIDSAAEARLQGALRAAPRNYEANRALGEFYLRAGSFGAAEPLLRTAAALHGNAAIDEYNLARACAGLHDDAEAERHVQQALRQQDTAEFHSLAGEVSEHLGQPLEAVAHFQRAAVLDPTEQNYFHWGSELLLHRAIWQAAEVFAKGSALYPQSVRLRTGWGAALFAGARYGEAAQRLCEAPALQPGDPEPYLLLGKAALAAPEPLPCARQRFADLLRQNPQNAEANYYSAMLLLQEGPGNRPAAEPLLKIALRLQPKLADASLQLGILAAAKGDQAGAIELYHQAIGADPNLAEAHYRLGLALDRSGRHDEARRELDLHAKLLQQQADAVEQQRRQVKQFLVSLQPAGTAAEPKAH